MKEKFEMNEPTFATIPRKEQEKNQGPKNTQETSNISILKADNINNLTQDRINKGKTTIFYINFRLIRVTQSNIA